LRTGFTVVHLAVLVAMAAALLGVAVWAFNRRDVAV
jgi:putative exporter of polyketide antibiotics